MLNITKCCKCDNLLNEQKVLSPPTNKPFIIGEAPGSDEYRAGKPFVGRSGKFLISCLFKCGYKRSDFYITNVIKCRPPNNRKPSSEEINNCLPNLMQEINELNPTVIILLGSTSSETLGFSFSLSNAGYHDRDGKTYLILPHPAFVLRNLKYEEIYIKNFTKLKEFINPSFHYEVEKLTSFNE